jgi:hypothetical protein
MKRLAWIVPAALLPLACNGTTGYELVTFYAAASGAPDAVQGQPYTFDAGAAHVTLTQATLHMGALYLTQSVPQSGGGPSPCTLPGTYEGAFVGEVRGGGDVDLLNPAVQQLPVTGDGTTIPAATGQVWLMHGDVNATSDPLPLLTLQGTVDAGKGVQPFFASITIDQNRLPNATTNASSTSGLPGSVQICTYRIVSGIPVDLTLAQSGTLVLRLDPKALFNDVGFSDLPPCGGTTAGVCFTNDDTNKSSRNLFTNLTTSGAVYAFDWLPPSP